MSQQRHRRPAASSARPVTSGNRGQRLYAILGIVVVIALVGTIAGPPLIDYLTRPEQEPPIVADEQATDPTEANLRSTVEASPNDPIALAALANYLGNTGRVDEAITWYEQALQLAPNHWPTRLGFARVLANGGKRPDAELQFQKVLNACPLDEQARFSLGQLYANWVPPRSEEAAQQYRLVIEIAPDSFVAERAREELAGLGLASPAPGTPVAASGASPANAEGCL